MMSKQIDYFVSFSRLQKTQNLVLPFEHLQVTSVRAPKLDPDKWPEKVIGVVPVWTGMRDDVFQ